MLDENNDINLKKASEEAKKRNMEILVNYLEINKFFDDIIVDAIIRENKKALKLITSNEKFLNVVEKFLFNVDMQAYMRADENIPTKILRGYNYFKQEESDAIN